MTATRYLSKSESDTLSFAAAFARDLKPGDVVMLTGELGAGKTAFTKGVVRFFDDKISVTSPTFSLINSYPTLPTIHHFDLYRVKDENDLVDLGIFEYVDAESILIVEWAEKWRRNRPEKYFDVSISIVNEEKRQIVIETRCDDRTGS